jgi:hypothetical protein
MKVQLKFLSAGVLNLDTEELPAFSTDMCLPRVCDWVGGEEEEGSPLSRGNDPSNGAN